MNTMENNEIKMGSALDSGLSDSSNFRALATRALHPLSSGMDDGLACLDARRSRPESNRQSPEELAPEELAPEELAPEELAPTTAQPRMTAPGEKHRHLEKDRPDRIDQQGVASGQDHAAGPDHEIGRDKQRGDWDLNPDLFKVPALQKTPKPAAVLVPVIARETLSLLFTLRPQHLKNHAGQISFPGGKLEAHDANPLAAALRETREEIGIEDRFIEPLGQLDSYRTGTGYHITPIVALVEPTFTLNLDPNEVAEAFEVPLSFFMDETNHKRHSIEWHGRERFFHAMPYYDRYIWGATAGMIKNMHERLNAVCSDS